MFASLCALAALVLTANSLAVPPPPAPDKPFLQDYHEAYPILAAEEKRSRTDNVRAIAVDSEGNVWAATRGGVFVLPSDKKVWRGDVKNSPDGAQFAITVAPSGPVWAGAWDGLYVGGLDGFTHVQDIEGPIAALTPSKEGVIALGPKGIWRVEYSGKAESLPLRSSKGIRAALEDAEGTLWVATGMGLYACHEGETKLYRDELVSYDVQDLALGPQGRLWVGCAGGITILDNGKSVEHLTPAEGLPSIYVRSVKQGPDGRMWLGTDHGLARYADASWSFRHGKRWLLDDEVRDIAFGPDGTAWVATARGVSALRSRPMTLAQKAEYFHEVCKTRHVRPPFLVEHCRLTRPGDLASWQPDDDDNDGGYTALYMAMESLRYAVTGSAEARTNAGKAFTALEFLQTVTGTPGFFARTVVPIGWKNVHDPGDTHSDEEWAEEMKNNPRNKRVTERWHDSADGEWRWKGDTSSDEATAHFFGYPWYYDLAADDAEKQRVRSQVRRIMDHIIEHGYVLEDVDGQPTCWGVWGPDHLNTDPDWSMERGINSVEILSYLKTAYHITGDERYQQEYLRLYKDCDYASNVRRAKNYAPMWRTHIDDELLAFAYVALFKYETDQEIRAVYKESLDHWYDGVEDDNSPFMNFIYAFCGGGDAHPDDSLACLRATPLDLIHWTVDNRHREDVHLVREPEVETVQTNHLLPVDERGTVRWDENPWRAVQGDGGASERAPTFWLFPYWLGRYAGWIAAPEPPRSETAD